MSIAGRKPKPIKLHIVNGNPSKLDIDKKVAETPKPDPVAPEQIPEWLLEEAKDEWREMAPQLEALGLLTRIDKAAFAGYCQSYATWKLASDFVKKMGFTYKIPKHDKEGKITSIFIAQFPEVSIASNALNQVRQFCAEFGLTPSSRGRITLPTGDEDENPIEAIMKGR